MNGIKRYTWDWWKWSSFLHLFLSSLPSTFAETGSDKDPGVGTGGGWAVTFFQSNKPISIFPMWWGCGSTNLDSKWHFYKDSLQWRGFVQHSQHLSHNYVLHFKYSKGSKTWEKRKGGNKNIASEMRESQIVYLIDPCFGRFKLSAGWWQ